MALVLVSFISALLSKVIFFLLLTSIPDADVTIELPFWSSIVIDFPLSEMTILFFPGVVSVMILSLSLNSIVSLFFVTIDLIELSATNVSFGLCLSLYRDPSTTG